MLERLTVKERIELRRPVAKAQGNSEPNPIDAESEAVEQDLEQDSGQGSSPPIGGAQSICPKGSTSKRLVVSRASTTFSISCDC